MRNSRYSQIWRLQHLGGVLAAGVALTACQHLGPWALEEGRARYNEKIHVTARDQLFANIIRVAYSENPLFMDVSEVDAAEFVQGMVSGGFTGIGTLAGLQGAGAEVLTSATAGTLSSRVVTNRAGAAGGSFAYQESPTIRYFPLSGQALVAQIATPISVTSIASVSSSDWPFLPMLDFALDRATPNYSDFYAAVNAIAALYYYGAVVVTATKSDATRPEDPMPQRIAGTNITVQGAPPPQQAPDSMTLYLQPDHPNLDALDMTDIRGQTRVVEQWTCNGEIPYPTAYDDIPDEHGEKTRRLATRNILHYWIRLLRIYAGTQVDGLLWKQYPTPQEAKKQLAVIDGKVTSATDSELTKIFLELPTKLELRTSAVPTKKEQSSYPKPRAGSPKGVASGEATNNNPQNKAPVILTHSALGMLIASQPQAYHLIEYVTPETFGKITKHEWNTRGGQDLWFYTLLNDERDSAEKNTPKLFNVPTTIKESEISKCVSNWVNDKGNQAKLLNFSPQLEPNEFKAMTVEDELGKSRKYILIIVAPPGEDAPPNAYVVYTKHGRTFYIDGNDAISQKNFALLSLFTTIQAIAPTTGPLTPTISVGAGG